MAVVDDKIIKRYLQKTVDKFFKILPLYEEDNNTLNDYINSLIIELKGFVLEYGYVGVEDYVSIVSTLRGLGEVVKTEGNQPVVKREVFKSIEAIKKIHDMLEGD